MNVGRSFLLKKKNKVPVLMHISNRKLFLGTKLLFFLNFYKEFKLIGNTDKLNGFMYLLIFPAF